MNKTLLAILIAATSSSVLANEIYSNETTKVSMKGEVDAYFASTDIKGTKTDADVNMWAKIQMDAEQKLSDTLTSFASFEIESGSWYDGTDSEAKFDDVYVGVKTDIWGIAVGETGDLADSMDAIEKDDITNEGNYLGGAGGHHRESKGKGIVAKTKFGPMSFVVDYNTVADDDIDSTIGVSADYSNDFVSVGASYISGEADANTDLEIMGVSVSTEIQGIYLAATYVDFEGVNSFGFYKTADYTSGKTLSAAASYKFDDIRVYTTFSSVDVDDTNTNKYGDSSNWVVGTDYAYNDDILIFAEYQQGEADWHSEDSSTIVTGVYYTF
ncbi:porin [Aliivibrio kagoshimensis]|uniref:porin n=1 Tax=Aliivibrio kagoshimensis TaxID=2910230 RepID=UPI003D119434